MTVRRARHVTPDSSPCQASSPNSKSSETSSTGHDSEPGPHFTTGRYSRKKVEARRDAYRSNSGSDVEAIQFEPLTSALEEDQSPMHTRAESEAGSDDNLTADDSEGYSSPMTHLQKQSLPVVSGSRTSEDAARGKAKVQRGKVVRIPLSTPELEDDEDLLIDVDEDGEQNTTVMFIC